jgi:ParB family chromosome partitioning protein
METATIERPSTSAEQGNDLIDAPTKLIVSKIRTGRYNPRRFFDPAYMETLEASIKAQGLHTPILVRPVGDEYELVAGERRYRAFTAVFGPQGLIPVHVRKMTDEEANAAALTENVERAAMTPVEEAEAAAKCLGDCLGDRDEAAKRMGWSRATLDRRLALMYATDKVRDALQERKIDLGHAELLARCRKEAQDEALSKLLQAPKLPSVADLKVSIERAALLLDQAIFDKTGCLACHHNSANQGALFADAITDGRCTNKQCFEDKTEAEVKARADALVDEFQQVRIVRPGENLVVIPLVADGPKGVGTEQAQACRGCKDFGAVVSASPDKLGKVFKNICMNVPCNTNHVKARIEAEKAAEKQDLSSESDAAASAPATAKPASAAPKSGAANGQAKQQPKLDSQPKKGATSVEPSNRVKEYREKLWRMIFARVVPKLPIQDNRTVLMALCMFRPEVIDKSALCKEAEPLIGAVNSSTRMRPLLTAIADLEADKLSQLLAKVAGTVRGDAHNPMNIQDVVDVLRHYEVKVSDHWKMTKPFCELLTKNELDLVCEEIGVKAHMGAEYAKARNGSKDDFIKAVLGAQGFEFAGKVPKVMLF